MADGNNEHIKKFTQADIERYHKGQMNASEMHALEKAALDDPFLADAIEGYASSGTNYSADVSDLKDRLASRTGGKVVPIRKKAIIPAWLKVAAVVVFVASAILLVTQLDLNRKEEIVSQDSNKNAQVAVGTDSVNNQAASPAPENLSVDSTGVVTNPVTTVGATSNQVGFDRFGNTFSDDVDSGRRASELTLSAITPNQNVAARKSATDTIAVPQGNALNEVVVTGFGAVKQNRIDSNAARSNASGVYRENANYLSTMNIFRGQVIDAQNNPLPFANITNTSDNVGTYTDARGNFTLTSPDSIMNVRVRSAGFEFNYSQLNKNLKKNDIVLLEDKSIPAYVVSSKKKNSVGFEKGKRVLEEPEPADGWSAYDTYIVNNLNIPEDYKTRISHDAESATSTNEVRVSFAVDKNGIPSDFKIEKSLCKECDEEAIRLIKEGPKWKYKKKRNRVTVTVPF